jgi:hypothetical protein
MSPGKVDADDVVSMSLLLLLQLPILSVAAATDIDGDDVAETSPSPFIDGVDMIEK